MGNKWVDIHNDPDWQRYEKHVREEVVPNIENSSLFISITPDGKCDVKFAVELGFAIMHNKPILAVVQPGTKLSEKFMKIVDRVVELDMNDPTQRDRITDAIMEMRDSLAGNEEDGQHRHDEDQ